MIRTLLVILIFICLTVLFVKMGNKIDNDDNKDDE